MTKKLKILGPYTPEHPGPFCTRDGRAARIICVDRKGRYPIVALVREIGGEEELMSFHSNGRYNAATETTCDVDLMNAEEVPVAREFWVNEYEEGVSGKLHLTEASAKEWGVGSNFIRTIHVREVLPGDGE